MEKNKSTTYWYEFKKAKKINATTTRLANVTVWDSKWKKLGCEAVGISQKPLEVVDMIIRDYEISKIWNKKQKQ